MRWRNAFVFWLGFAAGAALTAGESARIDPWVLETTSRGDTEFLVLLHEQADLRGTASLPTRFEKGAFVLDALRSTAERAQAPLLALLAARGAEYRPFWVADMIWVRGDRGLVDELAAREDVVHIFANPTVALGSPAGRRPSGPASPDGIEWNITKVHAPDAWALGATGQGIVVAGEDTGYQWDHPALKGKYRGWNGSAADHNYNWHDAIHSGGGSCGHDASAPCDDTDHGTHTMGTMVGDDGGSNRIGMAPGAKWIGCRNMDRGNGTPASYAECFQWFIAPTNLANLNPDPSRAPHLINNSWGCPPSEGCTDPTVLQAVVESARAAGIEVVVSAGNSGPSCSSVSDPAAIYDASFTVGATNSADVIASFSSRGPVIVDGSNRLKPDVSAPGVGIRSSVPGNGYAVFDGTSMAGPHVAGLVALLLSASPGLARDPDAIEPVIAGSCVPRTTSQTCGGIPGSMIPNATYGWGRVDALAAVDATAADVSVAQSASPDPAIPGVPVTYSVTVANAGPAVAPEVAFSEALSPSAAIDSATPGQGSCTLLAHGVSCSLGMVVAGGQATIQVVVTPSAPGTITSAASVASSAFDPITANNASSVQTSVVTCPFPAPTIAAPVSVPPSTVSTATSTSGPGHIDTWKLTGGAISSGQGTSQIAFHSPTPGATILLELVDTLSSCDVPAAGRLVSVDFLDVSPAHPFHDFVNTLARNGITAGCSGGDYCPGKAVTRAEMAVLLLRATEKPGYAPPPCTPPGIFPDVPCPGTPATFAVDWIEELHRRGIAAGYPDGTFGPNDPVTRAQMAVFLLAAKHPAGYAPAPCSGVFADVPCAPTKAFAVDWIERLYAEGVSAGCSTNPLLFCPDAANTRGEMAVFLTATFGLQ